ncbi:MAG: hypothetical protein JWO41_841 [Candidatus Saccharibacteria bacterium]|nr:hypothetical protein [Candidatus Saccharibacteria bacterium]
MEKGSSLPSPQVPVRPNPSDFGPYIWDRLKPGEILEIKTDIGSTFWITITAYTLVNADNVSNVAIQTSDRQARIGGSPIGQRVSRDINPGEKFNVNGQWVGLIKSARTVHG